MVHRSGKRGTTDVSMNRYEKKTTDNRLVNEEESSLHSSPFLRAKGGRRLKSHNTVWLERRARILIERTKKEEGEQLEVSKKREGVKGWLHVKDEGLISYSEVKKTAQASNPFSSTSPTRFCSGWLIPSLTQ
jgi:hypothetical protein